MKAGSLVYAKAGLRLTAAFKRVATPRLHQKLSLPARGWDSTGVQPPVLLHLNSPQLSSRALSFFPCLGCSDKETSDVSLVHAPLHKTGNHRRVLHKRMCHHFQPDEKFNFAEADNMAITFLTSARKVDTRMMFWGWERELFPVSNIM